MRTRTQLLSCAALIALITVIAGPGAGPQTTASPAVAECKMTTPIPPDIAALEKVETCFGTLNHFYGFPDEPGAEKLFGNFDLPRTLETYLPALPSVRQVAMRKGLRERDPVHITLPIIEQLFDSRNLFLTANSDAVHDKRWHNLSSGPLAAVSPSKVLLTFPNPTSSTGTRIPSLAAGSVFGSRVTLSGEWPEAPAQGASIVSNPEQVQRTGAPLDPLPIPPLGQSDMSMVPRDPGLTLGVVPGISFAQSGGPNADLRPLDGLAVGGRLFNDSWAPLRAQAQPAEAQPQDEAAAEQARKAELARKLNNPVSDLISVPFQNTFNFGIGPARSGVQDVLDIQPVVPFSLNENWNFVARMILPIEYQNEIFPGAGSQFGLGDTTFETFFSPKEPEHGLIWGVGPTVFAPTGTEPLLSLHTWGAGIDAVALTQIHEKGGVLTAGILGVQTWSVSGPATINNIFLEPFVAFTFPDSFTIHLRSESTLSWNTGQWLVPIFLTFSKVFRFGDQPHAQLAEWTVGPVYYPVGPVGTPSFGVQAALTLLFPGK